MPRKLRSPLESHTGRLRLPIRKKPHWLRLGAGLTLGYRRNQGAGTWSLRAAAGDGTEWLKKFGVADDYEPADGKRVFSYDQAVAEARKLVRRGASEDPTRPVTLDEALTQYEADLRARGANVYNARHPRRHLTASLLSRPVVLIGSDELRHWRDGLVSKGMTAPTVNRLRSNLRAALELAAKHRSHIWKTGLESLPDVQRARNVVLSDTQVLALVAAAYRLDLGFGLFCDVLATTGARPSQAARLLVDDLRADLKPKLMMPASAKGGGRLRAARKLGRFAVPITPELAVKLKAAAAGRVGDSPLLLRSTGEPWSASKAHGEYRKDIQHLVVSLGYDAAAITLYSLRHSSITRMLLRGVPIRVVASTHDTSVAQIEKHYSRYISDHSDDLTRAALLQPEPDDQTDNVIPLVR